MNEMESSTGVKLPFIVKCLYLLQFGTKRKKNAGNNIT